MNVLLKKRISRYLTVIAIITFITACTATKPPKDTPPTVFSELTEDSAFYLEKDKNLGSDNNLIWQFLAVQALIKEDQFFMADAVIASLQSKKLDTKQSTMLNLLIANNFYSQNKLPEAQISLSKIDSQSLKQVELIHYLKLQTMLHIRNELPLNATETLFLLTPYLTIDKEKQAYNDVLFGQLILLTSEQLNQYQVKNETIEKDKKIAEELLEEDMVNTPVVPTLTAIQTFKEGWYALATIYQKSKFRSNRLVRQLKQWEETHSDHAALQFMPLILTNISEFSPYQPENIAVLLPFSGQYSQQAKAIQMGFLNAYYHQQKSPNIQALSYIPKLHFFNTQTTDSVELASQLKEADIDFVVGPLMKTNIESLLPLLNNIPVLALNSFTEQIKSNDSDTETENIHNQWHYTFPLSPEDEAKQAAIKIYADQHKYPLIIAPNSNYGRRVALAFKEQWAKLSEDYEAEAHYFNPQGKYSTFIADALHTNKSKSRIQQIKAITHLSLKTEVRSRRDIDAIYIISKRNELIFLKPFIDVSTSPFAEQIPLYASSRSHSLDRNKMQNKELSGLVFSDNPFLLDPESELSKEVESAWKKQSFEKLRLFSLGFDSYKLIGQLIYLQNNANATYKGLIGDIKLGSDNSLQAKLSWAKYQGGRLIEITETIPTK